jgi:hypothetical protein
MTLAVGSEGAKEGRASAFSAENSTTPRAPRRRTKTERIRKGRGAAQVVAGRGEGEQSVGACARRGKLRARPRRDDGVPFPSPLAAPGLRRPSRTRASSVCAQRTRGCAHRVAEGEDLTAAAAAPFASEEQEAEEEVEEATEE